MRVARGNARSVPVGSSSAASVHTVTGATTIGSRVFPASPFGRGLAVLLRTVFSFEAVLALFLYSNNLKIFFPAFPVDETIVLLVASAPSFLYLLWRDGLPRQAVPVLAVALLFFGWMTLGLFWTPSRTQAIRIVGYNLVFNLYALTAICLVVVTRRSRLRRFLLCVAVIGLFLAGNGLWIWATTKSFRFYRDFAENRIYLAWGYPAAAAAAVILAASLRLPLFSWRQLTSLLLLTTLVLFLLISTGRGPLLAFVASALVPLLAFKSVLRPGSLAISRIQIFTILVLLAGAFYVAYTFVTGQLSDTLARLTIVYNDITGDAAYRRHHRLNYWRQALYFWEKAPWFGHGPASFSILYGAYEDSGAHPHNVLLEIAVDYGLLGIILFLTLLYVAIRGFRVERFRHDPDYLCVWMVFAGVAFGAMVSVDLAAHASLFAAIGLLTLPAAESSPAREREWITR